MKILISNDDGIYAEGLRTMVAHLEDIAEIVVVAPDRNRSGASNSLTLDNPLRVQQIEPNYYSVQGTPTDCVHLALTGLLDFTPDIVLSGINDGPNMGDDILYSGTVAAAMEGRNLGYPAVAFSTGGYHPKHFATAAAVARQIVLNCQNTPLQKTSLLNVNIPDIPLGDLKGFEVTRLGTRHQAEPTIEATDPRGHSMYWVGLAGPEQDAGPGTDFWAIKSGNVSITPLHADLTNYKAFENVSCWFTNVNEFDKKMALALPSGN